MASPSKAAEDPALCNADHSRLTIPASFVLPACFDGTNLVLHNDTDFPLNIKMSGDIGTPVLHAGGDQAAWVVQQFSVNEGDLMPDYRMILPVGTGAGAIQVGGSTSNRTYLLVRAILGVVPVNVIQAIGTFQALTGELTNVWQKYQDCILHPGFFGALGCEAIYYRDVAFALTRFGVQLGAKEVISAVLNLLSTAQWAAAAPGEIVSLRNGDKTLNIPASAVGTPTVLPTPTSTSSTGNGPGVSPVLGIRGSCTTDGGTLTGASSGFTPGGTYYVRAWYPNGSEYTGITHSGTVHADGSITWIWPCAGDPPGTYATQVTDQATGRSTGSVPFTIENATPGPPPSPTQPPAPAMAYNNYGPANAGRAMCRGNPGRPESMPGGTASQSFTVPSGITTLSSALAQIDPDSTVTAHLTLSVNGTAEASADAAAAGDTQFTFSPVAVQAGESVTIAISFTATYGKIITVYTAGDPGGTFTASNSCSDGAPNVQTSTTGLRAVVSGTS